MLPNTHSKCYIDLTEKHLLYTLSASNQSVSKVLKKILTMQKWYHSEYYRYRNVCLNYTSYCIFCLIYAIHSGNFTPIQSIAIQYSSVINLIFRKTYDLIRNVIFLLMSEMYIFRFCVSLEAPCSKNMKGSTFRE